MMKLIGTETSPFVRKVRIVLAEKKLDYQWVTANPWLDENPAAEVNPLGKIPALVLEEKFTLFESYIIVEYLSSLTPVRQLIPTDTRQKIQVKLWEALADGLLDSAVLIRKELERTTSNRSKSWIAWQNNKINKAIAAMNSGLQAQQEWYCNTRFSLADIAVGVALDYLLFRFPEIQWQEQYPQLATFLERLKQKPSFSQTAPQIPVTQDKAP